MTCHTCKGPIYDEIGTQCRKCIKAQSRQSVLERQVDFLPAAIAGNPPFRILRRRGLHDWHVEMLGFHGQAFCGLTFDDKDSTGSRITWDKDAKAFSLLNVREDLCADCRATLAQKVKEIARAEVA